MLIDSFGRRLNYLRMAITDRCNLRCHYCMPMQGLDWIPKREMLSYEEMILLCQVFAELGVEKIRFTGGEPTLRKDFAQMVNFVSEKQFFKSMHLTTNGTKTLANNDAIMHAPWSSVNISLDSLDAENFNRITGRNKWFQVMETIQTLIDKKVNVRINVVVMDGQNDHEILDFVDWAFRAPIDVRFIEEMPFNGSQGIGSLKWNDKAIFAMINEVYPLTPFGAIQYGETAAYYQAPSMQGRVGIIAAYSRSFCGTCNRLRVTPQGLLRTCLYSDRGLQLRDLIRTGASNETIKEQIAMAVSNKEKNGFVAESKRASAVSESMAQIGG